MNIAFDASPLTGDLISGVGWCEAYLTEALARLHPEESYRFEYFTLRAPEEKVRRMQPFVQKNTPLHPARFSPLLYRMLTAAVPLPYRIFQGKWADITHFFNYIVPPCVHGRTVVTVHDMVYKAFPETVRGRTKFMLNTGLKKSMKRADLIVTDSEFSKREILKYFPKHEKKLRVVPCGVDLERFKPTDDAEHMARVRKSLEIDGDYFLYLGTIEPRKNLERLIRAYSLFSKKNGGDVPRLVLAGGKGWLYDSIFRKVKDLGLSENVIFTQYVPSEFINPLMCGAISFVFPSIYEGFGMPPLEAMACGVPVLSSNSASLPEVTADCAVICDAYSCESIADGLFRLYSDDELRKDLSKRGIERAKKFTWEKSAECLYNVYKELF